MSIAAAMPATTRPIGVMMPPIAVPRAGRIPDIEEMADEIIGA